MLRLLYKLLLVSLLSGSLLMLDFSYKGVNLSALKAETLKTEKAPEGDLASTLVMTGVGLVTSRLYACKMTTDMMVAAAGGLAFLAGEVTSYFQEKKALKDQEMQILRDVNGSPTQLQIDLLKKLRESYEDANKTAGMKKSFQQAAAAAFLAATGVAIYLYSQETATQTACRTTAATAVTTCAALVTCPGTCCVTCGAAVGFLGTDISSRTASAVADAIIKPSSAAATAKTAAVATQTAAETGASSSCPASAGAVAACAAVTTLEATSKGVCLKPLAVDMQFLGKSLYANRNFTPILPEKHEANIFETIFMQTARADLLSPMGIASSAAISFVMMTSSTLGMQVDTFMFSPVNRAMIWGVLGGLAMAASAATSKQMGIISENIAKIDKILNSMNALHNGVGTSNPNLSSNPKIEKTIVKNTNLNVNDNNSQEIDLKNNGGGNLPCITGEDANNCPNFGDKLNGQNDVRAMPDIIQQQISSISKVTDGLNGKNKIAGGTITAADVLGKQAISLHKEQSKNQKLLQEMLRKNGINKDVAKESSDLEKSMKAVIQKELDARKMSASEMVASFSGSKTGTGGSSAIATDANKNLKDAKKNMGMPAIAIPAASIPKFDGESDLAKAKALEDKRLADLAAAEQAELAAKNGPSIDDYALKNDITQDKDSSIFELISNRYQKSGYPRLFKRIK